LTIKHNERTIVMADPVLRQNVNLTAGTNTITPLGGYEGCVVLVPTAPPTPNPKGYNSYYVVWVYISIDAGPTDVSLPVVPVALGPMYIADLPDGFGTSLAAIAAIIPAGGSGGPPTGVNGS
jgi:hypothetical protein